MLSQLRILIIILGLILICLSLIALGFAIWPIDISNVQSTLEPTLFAPP